MLEGLKKITTPVRMEGSWNEESNQVSRIDGSHSGGYEEYYLLGYNAV
jgi:hypothetical protein